MAWTTVHKPNTVKIGNTAITGVVSLSWETTKAEIVGAADTDTHASLASHGTAMTRGSITLLDVSSAYAVKDSTGTLTADIPDPAGAANKTFSCASVSLGSYSASASRDSAAGVTIPWIAAAEPVIAADT